MFEPLAFSLVLLSATLGGGLCGWRVVYLLDTVQKGVSDIPPYSVTDDQPKRQRGLVQVHQQAYCQIPQLDIFKVETRACRAEEGGESGEQECEVGEAWDAGDERGGG